MPPTRVQLAKLTRPRLYGAAARERDGDQISLLWKCTDCDGGKGEFHWTNGTGKYAGIKGRSTFIQTNAGPPDRPVITGFSAWKGEWELP